MNQMAPVRTRGHLQMKAFFEPVLIPGGGASMLKTLFTV